MPLESPTVPQLFSLSRRTVIVVGGGRGIGLAGVLGCLEVGASVHVFDALPSPPDDEWSIVKRVAESGGATLKYTTVDVTNEPELLKAFSDAFASASNPVTGLLVTAGVSAPVGTLEMTSERWDRTHDINVKGSFFCAQAFAKEWIARPREGRTASIILTSSIFGHGFNQHVPGPAYATSKAAVKHMAKVLGAELGEKGIRVNSISPGYVSTFLTKGYRVEHPEYEEQNIKMTAIGRISETEEFKAPVVFLLSQASSFVTGTDLLVDGGRLAKS